MTRINCIPVKELTGPHLVAEYRELPRVFALARFPKDNEKFPEEYTLGTGHVKFFYERLGYLAERHTLLVQEMKRRGYRPTIPEDEMWYHHEQTGGKIDSGLWYPWTPTPEAMALNRARIADRLNKKKSEN